MLERGKPPTINNVAELAGVSKRTVSRVINLSAKVNEVTRARVWEGHRSTELHAQPAGKRPGGQPVVFARPDL